MIHIILGTRAQLVKIGSLMHYMKSENINYNFILIPQHKTTMDSMLNIFKIKNPDIIVGNRKKDILKPYELIIWFFKLMLETLKNKKKIFKGDKNGIVLVHGDAPPALFGAIMAKFAGLKVGHIESGLRSYDIFNPFPEEIIRILTFKLSEYMFAPGAWAIKNLKHTKGIKVNTYQNNLLDSLKLAISNLPKKKKVKKYCIFTSHRFENLKNKARWKFIIKSLNECSKMMKTYFIMHPITEKKLKESRLYSKLSINKNIIFQKRMDYFDFIELLYYSEFLITDGGSNQEEAYYLGKPTLIMRKTSERKEGLGKNALLGKFNSRTFFEFINDYNKYKKKIISLKDSPSKIIVNELKKYEEFTT